MMVSEGALAVMPIGAAFSRAEASWMAALSDCWLERNSAEMAGNCHAGIFTLLYGKQVFKRD